MKKLGLIEQQGDFAIEELEKPEYEGTAIEDLMSGMADDGPEHLPGEVWEKLLAAAADKEKAAELPPSVNMARADSVECPVDKINNNTWCSVPDAGGQLKFAVQKKERRRKSPSFTR